MECIFAFGQRRCDHGANHIPVGKKHIGIDAAQERSKILNLIRRYSHTAGHFLVGLLVFIVRFRCFFCLIVIIFKGFRCIHRTVPEFFDGLGGILEIPGRCRALSTPQFLAQLTDLLVSVSGCTGHIFFGGLQISHGFIQTSRRLIGVVQRHDKGRIGFRDGLLKRAVKAVPHFHRCSNALCAAVTKGFGQHADLIAIAAGFCEVRITFFSQRSRHIAQADCLCRILHCIEFFNDLCNFAAASDCQIRDVAEHTDHAFKDTGFVQIRKRIVPRLRNVTAIFLCGSHCIFKVSNAASIAVFFCSVESSIPLSLCSILCSLGLYIGDHTISRGLLVH